MFVWLLFCIIYYFFLIYPVKTICKNNVLCQLKKNYNIKYSILLFCIFVVVGEILYFLISHEKFIYFWDYGGYYTYSLDILEKYKTNHLSVINNVYVTSVYNDYGNYISAIIAYPLQFTQGKYVDYIILLYVMFGIPFAVSLSLLVMSILKLDNPIKFILCTALVLICPGTFFPMLMGYPGIAAYIPILCSLWLLFTKGMNRLEKKDMFVLSYSLIFSFVLRRWFSFYVLAFVFASIAYSITNIILDKKDIKKEGILYVKNYLVVGIISFVTISVFLFGLIKRIFFTDYSKLYNGYNLSGYILKYQNMVSRFGILFICLFLFSCLWILFFKRHYLSYVIFAVTYEIISTLALFHVLSPTPQLYWIFYLPILIVCLLFLFEKSASGKYKYIIYIKICISVLLVLNSIYVYSGSFKPNWSCKLFQRDRYYVKIRSDIDVLHELGNYVEKIADNNKLVYVTASDDVLNVDIMNKLYLPSLRPPFDIPWIANVDSRDGFSTTFFDSEIIITTDTNRTHLGEANQRCITVLNECVQDSNNIIGQNFIKDRSFYLDNNVIATIYIRKQPWSIEAVDWLENVYNDYYPDKPEFFKNRFEEYKQRMFATIQH